MIINLSVYWKKKKKVNSAEFKITLNRVHTKYTMSLCWKKVMVIRIGVDEIQSLMYIEEEEC